MTPSQRKSPNSSTPTLNHRHHPTQPAPQPLGSKTPTRSAASSDARFDRAGPACPPLCRQGSLSSPRKPNVSSSTSLTSATRAAQAAGSRSRSTGPPPVGAGMEGKESPRCLDRGVDVALHGAEGHQKGTSPRNAFHSILRKHHVEHFYRKSTADARMRASTRQE